MTLPSLTVGDAQRISDLVTAVDLKMASVLHEIRSILSSHDMLDSWDDEQGWFNSSFENIVSNYYTLQRAHLELTGGEEGLEHQLTELVDAQRAESNE